jgi:hypothetical protein
VKEYDAGVVKDHWSKQDLSASDKNFYCFPPIRARSSKKIFDEDDARRTDWCEYWTVERYLKDKIPIEDALISTGELSRDNAHIICRKH